MLRKRMIQEGVLVPRGAGGRREEDGGVEVNAGFLLLAILLARVDVGDGELRALLPSLFGYMKRDGRGIRMCRKVRWSE